MKILHIEDRIHPEMGYQVNFFAKFHDPSHSFIILTTDSFSLWKIDTQPEILKEKDDAFRKLNQIEIIRNKACFDRKGKNNLWIRSLAKTIAEINPDVIFTHGIETFTTFRILQKRRFLKKYLVVTDTHTLYNQFNDSLKFKIYLTFIRWFVSRIINHYSIPVFATTDENKEIAIRKYGIRKELIFPCPIGTDLSGYFFDNGQREITRGKLDISNDEVVLIYAGKLNHLKQPHLILDALKILESNLKTKMLLLFIGTKDKEYFDQYFNVRFTNPNIRMVILPQVNSSTLYTYYSASDFAVFPKENTLSSLDVQACKLPLIMEDDITNRNRLKEGGLMYQPGNINDLAEKIQMLANNLQLRNELGEKGLNYVRENFDYRTIVRNMEKKIEKLLAGRIERR